MPRRPRPRRGVSAPLALALSSLTGIACACGERGDGADGGRADALPRRNALLVVLDTTRADHLGSYGYPLPTSPHLDALAAEGALFELAVAQASVTPVSCASILTGLDPPHHGLRVLHGLADTRLPPERVTLAEVWQRAGGDTAAFVSAYPAGPAFGLAQGFARFDARFPQDGRVSPSGIVTTGMAQRRADATTRAAISWLHGQRDPARPFLLWVHYFDAHDPQLLPPERDLERFPPASGSREDRLRALYDAEIAFADAQLGRLLAALRSRGLLDETVVAVIADHGEGLGDHGWWTHGLLYQEQIRVPLVLRVPGAPAGLRIPSLVRSIDVAPTLLEAAGVDRALWPPMDGASLLPLLAEGASPAPPRLAYADSLGTAAYVRLDGTGRREQKDDELFAILDGRYKLIHHRRRPEESELYDLLADPHERHDLAAEQVDVRTALTRELEARGALADAARGGDAAARRDVRAVAPELEALGYVDPGD